MVVRLHFGIAAILVLVTFGVLANTSTAETAISGDQAPPDTGVTIGTAISIAEQATGGNAAQADLIDRQGNAVFSIKIQKENRDLIVDVDGHTGAIIDQHDLGSSELVERSPGEARAAIQ